MSTPIQHHYVPRFYQEKFIREDEFWVFDILQRKLRSQHPKTTATIRHFYSLVDKEGSRNVGPEEELSNLEGQTATVLRKIDARERLSEADRNTLALFIAMQRVRGPDFHDDIGKVNDSLLRRTTQMILSDPKTGKAAWEEMCRDEGEDFSCGYDEALDYVLNGDYTITTERNESLLLMFELAPGIANVLLSMNWIIQCAPSNKAFITSDTPLAIAPMRNAGQFRGVGIATPGANKLFPLSASSCLLIGDPGTLCEYAPINGNLVRMANLNTCLCANRFIIAGNYDLLKSLTERMKYHCKRGLKWGGSNFTVH